MKKKTGQLIIPGGYGDPRAQALDTVYDSDLDRPRQAAPRPIVAGLTRTGTSLSSGASAGSMGLGGGNAAQSMAQSPLFYDYRWSTPDKYYFPRNRVVANSIWREVYKRDPAVATATDMYAELPWSEFDMTGLDDGGVRRVYEDMFNSLNLVPKFTHFTRDYLITGELILHNIFNTSKGIWERTISHNPDYIDVAGMGMAVEQPLLWLRPTPEIQRLLTDEDPRVRKLRNALPRELVNAFRQKRKVPLDPLNTTYMPRINLSSDVRGWSLYTRLYRVIMYEDFIVNASLAVAQRNAAPLRIFKLGDPNSGWLPDADDEAAFAEMLSIAESDPLAAIIMHQHVSAELVGVSDRVLLISREWDFIERVKLLALGVSKSFLVGESSFACFEEGTPVSLADGSTKGIEEIKTGEIVLDHKGKPSKVVNNWCEGTPEELLEIEVWGGRKFRVTPNHRFPAWMWPTECACGCGEPIQNTGRAFACQDHAANVSRHHYKSVECPAVVHHGRHRLNKIPEGYNPDRTVEARKLRKGDFLKIPKKFINNPERVNTVSKDLARLLGYYLAEGNICWSKRGVKKTKPVAIRLTFGAHELDTWVSDVFSICRRLGLPCKLMNLQRKDIHTISIVPADKMLVRQFVRLCGEHSHRKKLDPEVLNWSDELLAELLVGYFRGDGCRSDKASPSQIKKSGCNGLATVQCGTVSKQLASQLVLVLTRLGYPVGRSVTKPDCSVYNRKPYNILRIQGKAAIDLAEAVWDETLNASTHNPTVWSDDEFMYVPVRSVKSVSNSKPVYNLEVEGTHTYLVCGGIATHNSSVAGLQTLLERLSNLRSKFENDWMTRKVCEPIAQIHEFYKRPESELAHRLRIKKPEEMDLMVPKFKWRKTLEPAQDPTLLNIWRDMKERGLVSDRTYSSGAGLDLDAERKNMLEEKKYKEEHPELYGMSQAGQPGQPGGPGGTPRPPAPGQPGGAPPLPGGKPPGASASREHHLYGSNNPYVVRDLTDEIEDSLDEFVDFENRVHVDDVREVLARARDDHADDAEALKQVERALPAAGTDLLSGS